MKVTTALANEIHSNGQGAIVNMWGEMFKILPIFSTGEAKKENKAVFSTGESKKEKKNTGEARKKKTTGKK